MRQPSCHMEGSSVEVLATATAVAIHVPVDASLQQMTVSWPTTVALGLQDIPGDMKSESVSHLVVSNSLQPHGLYILLYVK
mgnify:CR=1 FL=1